MTTTAEQTAAQVEKLRKAVKTNKLPPKDVDFALSLIRKSDAGTLTYNMSNWVGKLLDRVNTGGQTEFELPSVTGVVDLLARAKANGLKYPKLWLQFADKAPLRITVAGDKSRTPGWLQLTDGESFGSNKFFGRISPEGVLEIGRDGDARKYELCKLLKALAANPAEVAAEFGHLTGHCSFCSLPLTDERSTAVGYGSTCAEKYGLPWGVKAAKRANGRRS